MFTRLKTLCIIILAVILVGGCTARRNPLPTSSVPAPQLTPTPLSFPATATPLSIRTRLSIGLAGLDFDAFIENSYRQLFIRDPETVLELGLAQVYQTPTDQLTDISDEYIRETQSLEADILDILARYDRSSLSPVQQLTYDIYHWYLSDRVEGQAFMYDDYPVNPTVLSIQHDLLQWFTDLRPLSNLQDAQDYINCLKQVDTKFEQLVNGLQRREEKGVVLPGFLLDYVVIDLQELASSPANATPYYTAFKNKIERLTSLTSDEKAALLASAETAIKDSVLPAYQGLVGYLNHLQSIASNDAGAWKFPDGKEYYAYAIKHITSTSLDAEQIHALGLQALEQIHAEMSVIFDQLGYPQDETLPQLFNRVAADSGLLYGDEIVQEYEIFISAMAQRIGEVFGLHPGIGVIVAGDPIGGYYIPPSMDGTRPGIFYAQNTGYVPKFSMPTLAYHEAIPGHHTQLTIAQQSNLPSFRRGTDFTAYIEGWALYAEHLAYEMDVYANDPYGNLGRLQAEAFRAARLVVDTGLHSQRWTFNQALEFMIENTGMPEFALYSEVSRYISLPGQATAYYIGYTKILELRQQAMNELEDQFDLKEFHDLILGNGAMPLEILEQVVNQYIQTKLGEG